MIRFLAVLLVSSAALAQTPARVASLDWMTGTWVHEPKRVPATGRR